MIETGSAFSSFGELLKTFRKRQHLTQQQLAEVIGVHRSTLIHWEQGNFLPESKTMVLELARQLHLDYQESRQLLEASLSALAPHWLVPFTRNPFFTGREEILEILHTQLGTDTESEPTSRKSMRSYSGRKAKRVLAVLGDRVLSLEHIGSTSVPGLAAKPKIDMQLVVANSADEPAYVPDLVAIGYILQIREPDWYEHRMFKGPDIDINLHVDSLGCPEVDRVLLFRNWLRSNASDRQLYERTKRASRNWKYMQHYADAKTAVVEEILTRAQKQAEKGTYKRLI